MRIHNCTQGTAAWAELRMGIPTASEFDSILTRGGKKSESRDRYMLTLLAERAMGHPCQEHISMWMQRGQLEEARAVKLYEFSRGIVSTAVGFITDDDVKIGASPDRLCGNEDFLLALPESLEAFPSDVIGMEIKVPSEWVAMGYLLKSGKAYDKYFVQVQGQMLVMKGVNAVDVMSYHPEIAPAIGRAERDTKYQPLLDEAVSEFSSELEAKYADLVADGLAPEKAATQESLVDLVRETLGVINR